MGMVSLDGTWRCLSILSCVACPAVFMTLCAYPHVGHYQASHFVVLHLMSATTHLMSIKCEDSMYLLTGAARQDVVYPFWDKWDPCISSLINDALDALLSLRKFSPHSFNECVCGMPFIIFCVSSYMNMVSKSEQDLA